MVNFYFGTGTVSAFTDERFITTWSMGDGETLTLPTNSSGSDFTIDWGDGNTSSQVGAGTPSNTYTTAGDYTVIIEGTMPVFASNGSYGNRSNLKNVVNWGNCSITNLSLNRCNNLETIPDGPITGCTDTDLSEFMRGCTSLTNLPVSLFSLMPDITDLFAAFLDLRITSGIPSGLFNGFTSILNLESCFQNSRFTSVPADLFQDCGTATSVGAVFNGCKLTGALPSGLMDVFTLPTSFGFAFTNNNLTSVPADFGDANPQVTSYYVTFANNNITGAVPELWLHNPNPPDYDTGDPDGNDCFVGNNGASNWNDIPTYWK